MQVDAFPWGLLARPIKIDIVVALYLGVAGIAGV